MFKFRTVFTLRRPSGANAAALDKAVFEKQCILCEYRAAARRRPSVVRIALDKVRPLAWLVNNKQNIF